MTKKTPDQKPLPVRDTAAYAAALRLQHSNELNAEFARKTLAVSLVLGAGLFVSVCINGLLGYQVAHPPTRYFATTNGNVIPIIPTSLPAYKTADVMDFGARAIRNAFRIDFLNYRNQMSSHADDFSQAGFVDYYKAMSGSNLLGYVKDKKMNMTVQVGDGTLYRSGLWNDGRYAWQIQYPVTIHLAGQTSSLPEQPFIFTLLIERADVTRKPVGMEITQLVTRNAH